MHKLRFLTTLGLAAFFLAGCKAAFMSTDNGLQNPGMIPTLMDAFRHARDFYYPVKNRQGIYLTDRSITVEDARVSFRIPVGFSQGSEANRKLIDAKKGYVTLHRLTSETGSSGDTRSIGILTQSGCGECGTACHAILLIDAIDMPYIESIFTYPMTNVPYSTAMGYRCKIRTQQSEHWINFVMICNRGTAVLVMMESAFNNKHRFQEEFNRMLQSIVLLDIDARCERSLENIIEDARRGVLDQQAILGRMYKKGICVSRDYVKAKKWFEIADYNGLGEAALQLGFMYQEGLGVKKDPERAHHYFLNAVNANSIAAMELLANQLLEEPSSRENQTIAVNLLRKAVAKGSNQARGDLAKMILSGRIPGMDENSGYELLNDAAASGYGSAQFQMGKLFAEGKGVDSDRSAALAWYTLAATNGVLAAEEYREELEIQMNVEELDRAQVWLKTLLRHCDVVKTADHNHFDLMFF